MAQLRLLMSFIASSAVTVFTAVALSDPVEPLVLVMAAAGFFWSLDRLRGSAQPGELHR
jgi:hypothetical protein